MQKTRIRITLEPKTADMLREYAKNRNRTVSQEVAEMVQSICTAEDGRPEPAYQNYCANMSSGKELNASKQKAKKKKKKKKKEKKRN